MSINRSRRWAGLTILCCGLLAACGGTGSGGGNDGAAGGGGAAVTCDSFPNPGTAVTPVSKAGPPPAMTGGTLVEGTYVLTAWEEYNNNSNSRTHNETFVFANGVMKHVESKDGTESILAGTYTTSGTTMTWNIKCPQAISISVKYTATPTSMAFIAPDNADQLQTYTKQ
jgi:hypothetical protein